MFDTMERPRPTRPRTTERSGAREQPETIDRLERHLVEATALIARVTASMLPTIRSLDIAQVDLVDGARTLTEWLASRLDIEASNARALLAMARHDDPDLEASLGEGTVSVDRAVAVVRLKASGVPAPEVERSFRHGPPIGTTSVCASHPHHRLRRDRTSCRKVPHIQPTLDESSYRLWGLLTGIDGRLVENALETQARSFPNHPGITGSQARADALTSICDEWLSGDHPAHGTFSAELFIDAEQAAASNGRIGAATVSGPRVGPNTLGELLCNGTIGVTIHDSRLNPIATTHRHGAIPPAIRRAVLYRDGGVCVIDGCAARKRLQPHHIKPQTAGVDHNPDNLATLCWYHHHVVIHQMGYQLDPDTPPLRRRFRTRSPRDRPA